MADDTTNGNDPVNLQELLGKPMSEFPTRPNLAGKKTYYGKLLGIYAKTSKEKQTPYFEFPVRLTDPGADVPKESMDAIAAAGFSLADYDVFSEFYLTAKALPMFREFMESIGFDPSKSFIETLKLDPATLEPTADTIELVRGRDVICRTQAADDRGRVFQRLDTIAGRKAA